MGHCPVDLLDDLALVLAEVRTWPHVVERKPAVFYVGREPFLHFHLLAGARRRGDIKGREGWMQVDLPRPSPVARRRAFLREIRARYEERASPGSGAGPGCRRRARASPAP